MKSPQKVKIAAVFENSFNYECMKYECDLIKLDFNNWKDSIAGEKPHLVMIESVWGSSFQKIKEHCQARLNGLENLFDWCKTLKIPVIFRSIEDPVSFNTFIDIAKHCDYVFTTDQDCIPRYKEVISHENVFLLPHAAQIRIHHPVDREKEKIGKIAFAGTWYTNRPEREKDLEILLGPSIKHGLDIYDRNYHLKSKNFRFPYKYQPCIKGVLSYEKMAETTKKYEVILNVNTVKNSPTMLSRRVFEVLACGINLVSSYSKSLESMFRGIIPISQSSDETERMLAKLLEDKDWGDRLALLGLREICNKHTYTHRLETILEKTGLTKGERDIPGVSIISYVGEGKDFDAAIGNFERQSYPKKELILMLNDLHKMHKKWKEILKPYKDIKILNYTQQALSSGGFELAAQAAHFEYIALFDSRAYYGNEFIGDLMNAYKYTNAEVVGKRSHYVCLEGTNLLKIRCPKQEYCYVDRLYGPACILKKDNLKKTNFSEVLNHQGSLLRASEGVKLYAADRFNFLTSVNEMEAQPDTTVDVMKGSGDVKHYVTV